MDIAIIGYGNMGSGIAKCAVGAGHNVTLSGRHLDKASAAANKVGATAGRAHEAVRGAQIVILATPFDEQENAAREAGDLSGKVVVEISNPLKDDMSGLVIGHTTSAAEEVQKMVPDAKVVKAFNTIFAQIFFKGPDFGGGRRVPVLYAGDDVGAKEKIKRLAESMGFDTLHCGALTSARYLEPLGMLNITLGYGLEMGTDIAPTWMRRS